MARENAAVKARRYLVEGRIIVTAVTGRQVEATARGDGAVHRMGFSGGAWWCSCPARSDRCAHLTALRQVTAPESDGASS